MGDVEDEQGAAGEDDDGAELCGASDGFEVLDCYEWFGVRGFDRVEVWSVGVAWAPAVGA